MVQIYDAGHDPEHGLYAVFELLHGRTVECRWRRGNRSPLALVEEIISQTCGALLTAHNQGLVHRDIKAANIFLVEDPRQPLGVSVRLLDFAISKLVASHHESITPRRSASRSVGLRWVRPWR